MAAAPLQPAPAVKLLDRLIGYVSPQRGLRRYFDRQRLERAYEAASPRDGWRPRRAGASPNADHFADAHILRGKARSLVQNVPYIAAGMEALVSNIIGTGIMPRATGRDADIINTLWAEWVKVCDADGRLDFYGLQAAAYRAMEQDGEVLIRLRPRFVTDGLPVPLQLQLLEIDWLDTSRYTSGQPADGQGSTNQVINGIEYDMLGRVVAYWLWDQHPGDITLRRGLRTASKRVPAESIIHLYNPDRPGQGRGFSRLGPVIARVRDLQLLEDAELARKNLEARLSVLASGDVATMANPGAYGEAADPAAAKQTGDLGQLASGGITQLPPGVNLTVVQPTAAPGHVDNVKHHLHIIATGMGVTYEMLTGDMTEVNFSSARVRLIEFRRRAEQTQWLIVIPRGINPVWRAFVNAAQLAGKISRPDYKVEFATPKWDYVNPKDEVNSDLAAVSGGLTSISETIRRRGYDPQAVFAEIASDFETLKASGVLDILLLLQKGRVAEAVPAPDDLPTAKPAKAGQ